MTCGEKAMRPDRYGGMVCACGSEGKTRRAELKQWVIDHLKEIEHWNFKDGGSDQFLLSAVVMELTDYYGATIERIASDQWFGMETKSDTYSAWVEADYIEDAFYQTLKAFVEKPIKMEEEKWDQEKLTQ